MGLLWKVSERPGQSKELVYDVLFLGAFPWVAKDKG